MKDKICQVEVGFHPPPYFEDKALGLIVCSRHKAQFEERYGTLGPYNWEPYDAESK